MVRCSIILCFFTYCLTTFAQTEFELPHETQIYISSGLLGKAGGSINHDSKITQFYESHHFEPVWTDRMAKEFIEVVENSYQEGLNPEDYYLATLKAFIVKEDRLPVEQAEFELMLTDSFVLLASHIISGKVDPMLFDIHLKMNPFEDNPVEILGKAINNRDIRGTLYALRPALGSYGKLVESLATYRKIEQAGGWETITGGNIIRAGMEDHRVLDIRERLVITGDLLSSPQDSSRIFDDSVRAAVRRFQKRHGLEADGNVGSQTLAMLNVPVEDRIKDIMVNLERCRWMPRDPGEHFILVNIPAYEMVVIKEGNVKMKMAVAVGSPVRETPVFSANMTHVVLNPYWIVPFTILEKDIIPAQIRNPDYLKNTNIKVLDVTETEIDPSAIGWDSLNLEAFPYYLRQEPGPSNVLGEVKFIFPNPYDVYMHDTNHREIFSQRYRALSSGCIRLSNPKKLMEYLLIENDTCTTSQLNEILENHMNFEIPLKEPMPVHIQYRTSFIDENGILNFRKDIYNQNNRLYKALVAPARMVN